MNKKQSWKPEIYNQTAQKVAKKYVKHKIQKNIQIRTSKNHESYT